MRWLFTDGGDREEAAARAAIISRIDAWWHEFTAREAEVKKLLKRQSDMNLPEWMDQHLHAVDPRLCWEYGPAVKGPGERLVITPEGVHELRPMVDVLLQRAPRLPGWEFYPHRLADVEMAQQLVASRTGGTLEDLTVSARIAEDNQVDLFFVSPRYSGPDGTQGRVAAFATIETLLGEDVLDTWIGAVEVDAPSKRGMFWRAKRDPSLLPVDRLRPTVMALIDSLRDQLPDRPLHQFDFRAEGHTWSSFKLQLKNLREAPRREDLFIAITPRKDLALATFSKRLFRSERFSRFGERFAYLKIDGIDGLDQAEFDDREDIDNAVDEVLRPAGLGTTVGGGTGSRYSYVELALLDVPRALDAIRQRLRAGKIPLRTWVLFHDPEWRDEWVGMYDETPPPPQRSEPAE